MSRTRHCLLISAVLLAPTARIAAATFSTSMTPDQAVPPSASTASGEGVFRLDANNMLAFDITMRGLHGAETEASIHGPAPANETAAVVFRLPLGDTKAGTLGPLTAAQRSDLEAGLWYVNIHSTHHGSGEIRGQMRGEVAVEPATWAGIKEFYRGH